MIKPLKFIGPSKEDLPEFPAKVKVDIGHALFVAQQGGRAPSTKILQGFGGGSVVEVVEDFDGDAYRCVYTTKIKDVIYVLHAFQNKSKRGSETPKHDIDLVRQRLKEIANG